MQSWIVVILSERWNSPQSRATPKWMGVVWPKAIITIDWGNAPVDMPKRHDWPKAIVNTTLTSAFAENVNMPQSLTKLYAHLVFSTRNRRQLLDADIRPRVHGYIATTVRSLDSKYVVVGGVADHVHILFDMCKLHSPVKFVEQVKRESSKFIKTLGIKYEKFYWQRGYGMFSVSPTLLGAAEQYVRNQEEHHRTKTFQEEFREFLARYNIEYAEQYVWD